MTQNEQNIQRSTAKLASLESVEMLVAKLPASAYLLAGFGSILGSAAFQWLGKGQRSVFVGHWAPTFFVLGLYARVIKQRDVSDENIG